ncbi:MAG TPA: ketopantoate reductase C-terminal domain-containing protein, partial [Candidatus Thermoplasmatota archaeon]
DIEAGRPTEIDAITGEIARAARRHGIAVPVNTGLLRAVRAL